MKTKKKIKSKKQELTKCKKFFYKNNKETIIKDHILELYNSLDKICKIYNINYFENINLEKIIESIINKIIKKKGNLQYLSNSLFPTKYFTVSGFDLIKIINNKKLRIMSKTWDKSKWNKAQMNLQQIIVKYNSKNIKNNLIMMSEQYKLNQNPSENNSNQNEFETLYNNKNIDTSLNFIKNEEIIYHTYTDILINKQSYRVVNIHCSSSMKQDLLIEKIIKFLEDFPKKNNQKIILGGDSNIYYNRGITKSEKKWCPLGISNINKLMNKLFNIGYGTLISRNIIFKTRPYNLFNNAQSIYKNGEEIVETMFISFPLSDLKNINYDSDKYFISVNEKGIYRNINLKNIYKLKLNAFQGSESIGKNGTFNVNYNNLFDNNKGGAIISDHVPIYFDIDNTRIIFSNNASFLGNRGISNTISNKEIWGNQLSLENKNQTSEKINKNMNTLEKISNKFINIFLKNNISLLNQLNIDIKKIKNIKNNKKKLKYLTNLPICKL